MPTHFPASMYSLTRCCTGEFDEIVSAPLAPPGMTNKSKLACTTVVGVNSMIANRSCADSHINVYVILAVYRPVDGTYRCRILRRENCIRDDLHPSGACCEWGCMVRIVCRLFGVQGRDVRRRALYPSPDERVIGDGATIASSKQGVGCWQIFKRGVVTYNSISSVPSAIRMRAFLGMLFLLQIWGTAEDVLVWP